MFNPLKILLISHKTSPPHHFLIEQIFTLGEQKYLTERSCIQYLVFALYMDHSISKNSANN